MSLRNFPIREADDGSGHRRELHGDFNMLLLDQIWGGISSQEAILFGGRGASVELDLNFDGCSPILFRIRVDKQKSARQFTAELPDALIDAFERAGISPPISLEGLLWNLFRGLRASVVNKK